MITVAEARGLLKERAPKLRHAESLPLLEGRGLVTVQAITAPEPSPRFTNSAMDGVAVRFEDVAAVQNDRAVILQMAGESRAGVPFDGAVAPGEAVRISTGAVMPAGTDTVIPQEDVRFINEQVAIDRIMTKGRHVRLMGEEYEAGTMLAPAGSVLHTRLLSLLASQGVRQVMVFRPLRVSILSTGTEVVPWDEKPKAFQIRNSNVVMLESAVKEVNALVVCKRQCPDDESITRDAIREASKDSDLILMSGGVSVGPHDHVRGAAEKEGFSEVLWKVAQKPGKPLFVAERSDRILIGLPGNPAASYMCYVHYVRPFIRMAMGFPFQQPSLQAAVTEPLHAHGKRTVMKRVRLRTNEEGWQVVSTGHQGSHMITSFTEADGYVLLEPGQSIARGAMVPVFRFPEM